MSEDQPTDERDRREAPRHRVELPLECSAQEHFLYARMIDLSILGMFISTSQLLDVGSHIDLVITTPTGWLSAGSDEADTPDHGSTNASLAIGGRVVWANSSGDDGRQGMGIRFEEVSPSQKSRLLELIERVALVGDQSAA